MTLRRTLTWDQGQEMANHAEIADAVDLEIYFYVKSGEWFSTFDGLTWRFADERGVRVPGA